MEKLSGIKNEFQILNHLYINVTEKQQIIHQK